MPQTKTTVRILPHYLGRWEDGNPTVNYVRWGNNQHVSIIWEGVNDEDNFVILLSPSSMHVMVLRDENKAATLVDTEDKKIQELFKEFDKLNRGPFKIHFCFTRKCGPGSDQKGMGSREKVIEDLLKHHGDMRGDYSYTTLSLDALDNMGRYVEVNYWEPNVELPPTVGWGYGADFRALKVSKISKTRLTDV
jgi:hypothetical protein